MPGKDSPPHQSADSLLSLKVDESPSDDFEGGSPDDRSSKGMDEAKAIEDDNLQRIRQQTELNRHLHIIGIGAIYAFAVVGCVWILHVVLPLCWQWLDAEAQSDLLLVIVSVLSSWSVSYYFASKGSSKE